MTRGTAGRHPSDGVLRVLTRPRRTPERSAVPTSHPRRRLRAPPPVVTREEWLLARTALLERQKEMTRARDALSADRRRLPMVRVTTSYVFTGPHGEVSLLDLFEGRDQLVLTHVMVDLS